MECAVRLGKTQIEFERGYYVMDLLDVMDAFKRVNAQDTLDDLNVAVMSHTTSVEDFKRFAGGLQKQAGYGTEPSESKFDESGFKQLQMKLKLGI
ncbi:hypothetical protein RJP21_04660 [Paenibacillus sp. VCA1]|uniref:hypothetical protein n=1 Tax=Paenibacillus sp. VCA1 TaxID=3039148 RepID=UPI0028722A5A|nr:hypothetical protein [Paenibacillus sp. VCA1]MDR9852892.1 hypothetical protein [Paenibacillus sp. VCA1]